MLQMGDLVDGKYRILRKCGQGGMSVVYMAVNERANKTWAIKEVRKDGSWNFQVVKQGLLTETNLLKRLSHPHLPSIVDVIDQEGSFLIVMDYIEGRTLKDVLDEEGPQPQEKVLDWARQLCDVLGYLHSREPAVIYRDMKPSNVMLRPDGQVVLFDFGTAREYKREGLEDTTCLGTRGYAAPEQYGGQGQTDARTDLFCLGAAMYHLLTGHNPGEPPYEMYPIRRWRPELSSGLEEIICKCTQSNPADRYQSSGELLYALNHYWKLDQTYRRKQRNSLGVFLAPAAMSLLFALAGAGFYGAGLHVQRNSYDACLLAAKNAAEKTEEISHYRKAISLDPFRSEGYLGLLREGYLDDQLLTREESLELRQILLDYGRDGRSNESEFCRNQAGYEQFAYEAGIAYYYKFQERESKKNAKGYLEIAANSEHLPKQQRERARRLAVICGYYARIGIPDAAGDELVTYREYWRDLTELSQGNLVEQDNARTALLLYRELAGQIVSRAWDFRKGGVEQKEILQELEKIRTHIGTDFSQVKGQEPGELEEELLELEKLLEQAERMVGSAYGQKGQGV